MKLVKHLPDRREDPTDLPHKVRASLITDGTDFFVVSTIRLSIDHGYDGRPLWYETMVFAGDANGEVTNWGELSCDRYTTEEEAILGHERVLTTFEKEAA